MEKLKIGLFIDTFYPMIDGVINVVDNYAVNLSKYADVTIFCPKGLDKNYKDDFPYKVVRCKSLKFFGYEYSVPVPFFDRKFKKAIKDANLDIIHIHSPFAVGKTGAKYAKKLGIPCIGHLHSQFYQDFKKATRLKGLSKILLAIAMSTFNKCDVCWSVNDGVAGLFKNDYKLKSPIEVHPNATDFLPIENKENAVKEINALYDIKDGQKVFCFVGRLTALKNVFFIADALKILKDKGLDFKMIYVGSGFEEKELIKRISDYGLNDRVIFTGKTSDKELLKKIYLRSDLLLFPSPYDTDGLVKYEASSQGTPTVSVKGFYCASNLIDNKTGFLSDNSPESFAERIISVCENEPLLNEVSKNVFNDLYRTWENTVKDSYGYYLKLINDKKAVTR